MGDDPRDRLMTTDEALDYLGISRRTLFKYRKDPDYPLGGRKIGNTLLFTEPELLYFKKWMQSDEYSQLSRPGRKPGDPITRTVTDPETGEKQRINLRPRGTTAND